MTTYFEIIGKLDGEPEQLFGSFNRADCVYELDAERDSWKAEGYKAIKITSRETADTPDAEVYPELITAKQLWHTQAPCFNFELGEDELLEKALETGFVTLADGHTDLYIINEDYQGVA